MKRGRLSGWRALIWPWRRFPKTVGGVTGLFAVLCLAVVGSNAYILLTTSGEATGDVADVPPAEVGAPDSSTAAAHLDQNAARVRHDHA